MHVSASEENTKNRKLSFGSGLVHFVSLSQRGWLRQHSYMGQFWKLWNFQAKCSWLGQQYLEENIPK